MNNQTRITTAAGLLAIIALLSFQATQARADWSLVDDWPTLGQWAVSQALPGHRCPKLGNPIECNEWSEDPHGNDENDMSIMEALYPQGDSGWKDATYYQCKYYQANYILRHGPTTPKPLKPYRGCDKWKRDYDFWQHVRRNRLLYEAY